ncbi:MAG: DedA family protein, partial [Bacteroidetes bacterium]|nr:DedA family protein [Bacteroidota bacterium]
AGAWNIILASIGYYLESVVPHDMLMSKVQEYSKHISLAFIILGVFVFGFIIYKALKKRK